MILRSLTGQELIKFLQNHMQKYEPLVHACNFAVMNKG